MSDSDEDPRAFNRPDRPTLGGADVAGLGQAVITLTHEVWVLTDRLAALEAILEEAGIDVAGRIDSFTPDAALQEKLDERGRALVARVTAALANFEPESTD